MSENTVKIVFPKIKVDVICKQSNKLLETMILNRYFAKTRNFNLKFLLSGSPPEILSQPDIAPAIIMSIKLPPSFRFYDIIIAHECVIIMIF